MSMPILPTVEKQDINVRLAVDKGMAKQAGPLVGDGVSEFWCLFWTHGLSLCKLFWEFD